MTQPGITPAATTLSWTVVSQVERNIIDPNGNVQDVVTVTYQLANGQQGSVNIPRASYGNVDYVKQAIGVAAAAMHAVNQLSSDS